MNRLRLIKNLIYVGCTLTIPLLLSGQNEDKDTITLSPFTVEESDTVGYLATSTLAGSRLKTPLSDVGSAISVMTSAMFEDTGATDAGTILSYGLSTEVSGVNGNFADGLGTNHNGRAEQDQQRLNPQGSQRVRGLAEASLTRDFYLTDIPFDSYNTSRVDISRGANSLLFGVGAAGGIINNTLNMANADGDNFGEVLFRLGERGSNRESLDFHRVLIDDRLAIRFSALRDETNYQQKPAYELDKRTYLALDAVLFENEGSDFLGKTKLRANMENGAIRGAPPNVIPPTDAVTDFFQPPNIALLQTVPGVVIPGYYTGDTQNREPHRYHPEYGLTEWKPKLLLDTRLGLSRGNVPAVVERPLAQSIAVVYPNYDSTGPSIPTSLGSDIQAITGDANPSAMGLSTNFSYLDTGSFFMGPRSDQVIPNFVTPVILNKSLWDNEKEMIQGLTQYLEMKFDAESFALEQPLFNGSGGIEIGYDQQHYERLGRIPFSREETVGDSGSGDVVIDLSLYLGDGSPNPNVGRPKMKDDNPPEYDYDETDREARRATLFYTLDFTSFSDGNWAKWVGNHTFTGFYNEQEITNLSRRYAGRFKSDQVDLGQSKYYNGSLSNGRRNSNVWVYLGPSVMNVNSPSDVELHRIDIELPKGGDVFETMHWNIQTRQYERYSTRIVDFLQGGSTRKQVLDTTVASWQGRLFEDHIVALYGRRKDKSKTYENIANTNGVPGPTNPEGIRNRLPLPDDEWNEEFIQLQDIASNPAEGTTETKSLVVHVPDGWLGNGPIRLSGHWSESENFEPSATRRNIRGQVLAPPNGTTEEKGFSVNYEDKVSVRFNWYETSSSNASVSTGTANDAIGWIAGFVTRWDEARYFPMTLDEAFVAAGGEPGLYPSYEAVFDEIISWLPADIQAQRNLRYDAATRTVMQEPNPGQTQTRDFISKGFEVDLVANLTSNWRFAANVSQQEAVQSNTALPLRAVATEIFANMNASPLGDLLDTPSRNEGVSFVQRYNAIVMAPLGAVASRDNTLALELREWRYNVMTTYDFSEGTLKGASIGGAIRYQSKNAVGNPNLLDADTGNFIPDVNNPFFGPSQMNGDVWVSYSRPIFDGKFDWKIQLNIRNAFGDDDPIPVVINPDGQLAVVRNSNPEEIYLTNTFRF